MRLRRMGRPRASRHSTAAAPQHEAVPKRRCCGCVPAPSKISVIPVEGVMRRLGLAITLFLMAFAGPALAQSARYRVGRPRRSKWSYR